MLTYLVCKLHAWLSSSSSLSSSTNKFATRSIKRLFLLHLLVASCIYYMAVIHVDNTAWAKSIQNEKLFTPLLTSTTTVTIKKEKTKTEIVHPYNHLFQLTTYSPSTVPTKHDVLIGTRLHSQYLASNQYVLHYHPANIQFQKVLWSHAAAYMQHRAIDAFPLRYHDMFQIIRNIISSNNKNDAIDGDMNDIDDTNNTERRKVGRVLYQHVHDGQWSTLTIPQTINIIQYELYIMAYSLLRSLDESIKYMFYACYFGTGVHSTQRMGSTAMKRYSFMTLELWQTRIFQSFGMMMVAGDDEGTQEKYTKVTDKRASSSINTRTTNDAKEISSLVISTKLSSYHCSTKKTGHVKKTWNHRIKGLSSLHHWLNDVDKIQFPRGLQDGDIVDGQYRRANNEWYKGTIISSRPDDTMHTIRYDDGDIDNGMTQLHIRPFQNHQVGDIVEAAGRGDTFYTAKITRIRKNKKIDVMYQNGVMDYSLEESQLRRFDVHYKVGDVVKARFRGRSHEWFWATITKVLYDTNGTDTIKRYDVHYDDDEVDYSLNEKCIKLM
mmetsp:Transcript_19884/g.29668  ORF Transcript_19884/g.29668 Transcript_19884/m.29668 type:complete len:550 (-) Transcript_19884:123-1772(-)